MFVGVCLQAGVAMGLARIAGTAFSEWGPSFQTVMMAIIMINMLLGPPLFRTALIQVTTDTRPGRPHGSYYAQQGLRNKLSPALSLLTGNLLK